MGAVGTKELPAAEKSKFGVCGVVGGMMVIELLAGAMRRGRGGIAAVEDERMEGRINLFGWGGGWQVPAVVKG